jgi:transcriptional regulator GlxA family with amidase domain
MGTTAHHRQRRPEPIPTRQEVVGQAEAYLRAHMGAPVPLSRLCRIVGLSERGLRNAFYGVHGVGPKRWMLAERLRGARRALKSNVPGTVTGIATDYGFYDLGRFAASYKQVFGEAPSETLRSAAREAATEHIPHTKGQVDACHS